MCCFIFVTPHHSALWSTYRSLHRDVCPAVTPNLAVRNLETSHGRRLASAPLPVTRPGPLSPTAWCQPRRPRPRGFPPSGHSPVSNHPAPPGPVRRYMGTCFSCPKQYPWLYDVDGDGGEADFFEPPEFEQ